MTPYKQIKIQYVAQREVEVIHLNGQVMHVPFKLAFIIVMISHILG